MCPKHISFSIFNLYLHKNYNGRCYWAICKSLAHRTKYTGYNVPQARSYGGSFGGNSLLNFLCPFSNFIVITVTSRVVIALGFFADWCNQACLTTQ